MNTSSTLSQRSSVEELYAQSKYFTQLLPFQYFSDSLTEYVTVLNKNRQIIFCNQPLMNYLKVADPTEIIGKRPGEALQCQHADRTPSGCGTTEFCKMCGANQAILKSEKGSPAEQECRITTNGASTALDLDVKATPLIMHGEPFTIFAMSDVGSEKRKKVLEKLFFHDIQNLIGGLMGYSELLQDATSDEIKEFAPIISKLAVELNEQISSQQDLVNAEQHKTTVTPSLIHAKSFLRSIILGYRKHKVTTNKQIIIDPCAEDFLFISDETILRRVIGNLIKNALEATQVTSAVIVHAQRKSEGIEFSVINKEVIPRDIQLQIFQRSFSTKGEGRGLGTYSVKLFTEQYLGGKVSFKSNERDGTIFSVTLPLAPVPHNQSKSQEIAALIEEVFV